MTKVVTVIGARPQFIKAAPVAAALRRAGVEEVLVHTGQHYDEAMSGRFFSELGIPEPAANLAVGSGSQAQQTAAMMRALEPLMRDVSPDWVLIYGDTNSTVAAALVGAQLGLKVAHVEAGLRSYNRRMPEEINRIVADRLSSLLFVPTDTALSILKQEGLGGRELIACGDVMYDVALMMAAKAPTESTILAELDLAEKGYALSTIHRAENTDDPARLSALVEGLGRVAADLPVVLPLHPRTRKALGSLGIAIPAGLRLINPVGYLDMVRLTMAAKLVVTDSGGLQKEAYFHRVPCVTMRDETEWTELVESGWNRLAPPVSGNAVAETVAAALAAPLPAQTPAFYGTGKAADLIAERLARP